MKDLTGQKFGRLTAIERIAEKHKRTKYLCICDCGNKKNVESINLTTGNVKSCGCLKSETIKDRCYVDHSGKTFGRLYVIKRTKTDSPGKYLCQCECGIKVEVWSYNLTSGHTKSCGCLVVETSRINNAGKNNHGWKGGITKLNIALYDTFASQLYPVEETRRSDQNQDYLEVKCSKCQKWFIPKQNQTSNRILGINGKTQGESRFYCSEECKENCDIYKRVSKPKGIGKQKTNEVSKELRKMVLKLDDYECQKCGSKERKLLQVHHIYGAMLNPIFANDPDACITLCKTCHKLIHALPGCSYKDLQCKTKD